MAHLISSTSRHTCHRALFVTLHVTLQIRELACIVCVIMGRNPRLRHATHAVSYPLILPHSLVKQVYERMFVALQAAQG